MRLKVGQKVWYRTYGNHKYRNTIDEIRVCKKDRTKSGKIVDEADTDENPYGVILFKGCHWCWFKDLIEN